MGFQNVIEKKSKLENKKQVCYFLYVLKVDSITKFDVKLKKNVKIL